MQLSSKARKAVAAGLAASTILWSSVLALAPFAASAAVHTEGCLVLSGGVVWMITNGTRRGFTSAEVFQSWGYNFSQVVTATTEDVALPVGPIMTYADGTLVKGPSDPLVYLVTNGQKRGFVSGEVFLGLGFKFSNVQSAPQNTFADLSTGANLDSAAVAHPAGVKVISNGAIWLMTTSGRMGFPSMAAFNSFGYNLAHVVAANSYDLAMADQGAVVARPACSGGNPTSGSVNVSLAGPASSTLIVDSTDGGNNNSQAIAPLSSFVFTGNGTVTSLTLARTGVSTDAMVSNVYLFDGSTRITDAGAFSSNSLTFANGSGLFTVSGSKTITVRADLDDGSYAGQTLGVNLTGVVLSGGSVGGLPVVGNVHTIAAADLATVAIGAPTAAGASDPGNDINVWQSTFTVGVRDVTFSRLALRQVSNIVNSDVRNFRLLVDGVQVASTQNIDANGYVTFSGFSRTMTTGAKTVKVLADVIGGSSRSLQMSLRNKADVEVMDSQFNVNVSATGTFPASPTAIAINSGTMTVTKTTDSPSGNVTNNATSVRLGKWTVSAFGEPIKVETLDVAIDWSGTDADLTLRNGKLLVNGSQVGSTKGLVAAGAATSAASFTTNFTVNPGTPATVELYSDIFDEEAAGNELAAADTLQAYLIDNDVSNATRQVSLTTLDVPTTTDVAANQVTVVEGSMVLASLPSYPNQTTTAPQTNFKLGSWTLTGSTSEDITLTTLSLDIDSVTNATFSAADLSNIYIKYGSNTTSVKSTPTAADNDWSISYTLLKNQVLTIELYGDIGAAANITDADSVKTDLSVSGTTVSSGVAVSQLDKDGQTIIKSSGTFATSKDASSPISALLDDSGTVEVARYKVASTFDSVNLTEVDVNLATANAVSSVMLKVYNSSGAQIASATLPASTSMLFTLPSVNVPSNSYVILGVELVMSTIGPNAGTTDSDLTATLDSVKYTSVSSGTTTTDTNDRAANAMYAYKAVPVVSAVALPNTVLAGGEMVIAKFTVSSNGTGLVAWKQAMFEITKSAAPTLSAATLWNSDTGTQITAASSYQNGTAGVATTCVADNTFCELLITVGTVADDDTVESVSGAKTYEVRSTVAGTLASGNSVSVKLDRNTVAHAASAIYVTNDNSGAAGNVSFVWSDESSTVTGDTGVATWQKDFLVKNLPINWALNRN